MERIRIVLIVLLLVNLTAKLEAQAKVSKPQVLETMLKATKFMVEEVSTNGGYVWCYLPDFSRRWGEMEAYKTMIWLQGSGTIGMGNLFLDAYQTTKNEYYYKAAEKTVAAIIWGQSYEGGWNYMVDFAGDRSLKQWYKTIGKNGWRLEEFQHYYGNSTFDDDITSNTTGFLLRMYLEKMDPRYKPALDKAINFILKSQYPNGGWPQRYPLRDDFEKQGFADYTSFYTFNDNVIWENIKVLIQCYLTLGESRFLDSIYSGMQFYKISQYKCGAWGQQINMDMQVASARTYEPAAFLPSTTCENAFHLMQFYKLTGDKQFLEGVPKAIRWLEETMLPEVKREGSRTHPTFIDVKTNAAIYVHRKGSNVKYGRYYTDKNDNNLLVHYYGKSRIPLKKLKAEYDRVSVLTVTEATKKSALKSAEFKNEILPQQFYNLNNADRRFNADVSNVTQVINTLDSKNRWLTKDVSISNPYIGEGVYKEPTMVYATSRAGDLTDTSPYRNTTDQEYISTRTYIRNMKLLINYIQSKKK